MESRNIVLRSSTWLWIFTCRTLTMHQNLQKFEKFKERLEHFAKNHRAEIQKNPEFRRQFQSMCASIGVDPLASSRGFWADMLGVGDYYYELAVRVVEYCLANRNTLGGLIQMSVIAKYLGENPNDITIALKVSFLLSLWKGGIPKICKSRADLTRMISVVISVMKIHFRYGAPWNSS